MDLHAGVHFSIQKQVVKDEGYFVIEFFTERYHINFHLIQTKKIVCILIENRY